VQDLDASQRQHLEEQEIVIKVFERDDYDVNELGSLSRRGTILTRD
jgi:hypothetical protein